MLHGYFAHYKLYVHAFLFTVLPTGVSHILATRLSAHLVVAVDTHYVVQVAVVVSDHPARHAGDG